MLKKHVIGLAILFSGLMVFDALRTGAQAIALNGDTNDPGRKRLRSEGGCRPAGICRGKGESRPFQHGRQIIHPGVGSRGTGVQECRRRILRRIGRIGGLRRGKSTGVMLCVLERGPGLVGEHGQSELLHGGYAFVVQQPGRTGRGDETEL